MQAVPSGYDDKQPVPGSAASKIADVTRYWIIQTELSDVPERMIEKTRTSL